MSSSSSTKRCSPTSTVDVIEQLYLTAESVEPSVNNTAVYDSGKFQFGSQAAIRHLLSTGKDGNDWVMYLRDFAVFPDGSTDISLSDLTDVFVGYYTLVDAPTDMTATLRSGGNQDSQVRFPAKLVPGRITFAADDAFIYNTMPTRFMSPRIDFSHPELAKDFVHLVCAHFDQDARMRLCCENWVADMRGGEVFGVGEGLVCVSPSSSSSTSLPFRHGSGNRPLNWMLSSHARRMQIWREKSRSLLVELMQRVSIDTTTISTTTIRVLRLDEVTVVDGALTAEETAHLRALSMAAAAIDINYELRLHSSPETAALLQTALRRAGLAGPIAIPPMVTLGRSTARGLHMDQSLCKGSTASALAFLDDAGGGGGGEVAFYPSTHEPPRIVAPRAGRLVIFSVRLVHEVAAPRGDKFIAACEVSGW